MAKIKTVGELRLLIEGLPDHTLILLDNGETHLKGIDAHVSVPDDEDEEWWESIEDAMQITPQRLLCFTSGL